jgi:L-asparaginase
MSKLLFILTGGTIDSFAEGYRGTAIVGERQTSFIPDYLVSQQLYLDYDCVTVCLKDSGDVNQAERDEIIRYIEETDCAHVIVTYGTDAMVDAAREVKSKLTRADVNVLFTGAILPLEAPFSDGGFNLGYALSKVKNIESGVFVAMHGRIFSPDNVIKNRDILRFEEA